MPTRKWLPKIGRFAHFHNRKEMRCDRYGHLRREYAPVRAATLPINWYGSLSFPMDDNGKEGDCMLAAAEHADNTFTGNNGAESVFDDATTLAYYLKLSGGDNGLNEGQLVGAWKSGLPGIPQAVIYDALDIDPTNAAAMQAAIQDYGGVLFMLAVPDAWINDFAPGCVWDAPATANQNNGHGVWIDGVDAQGRYHVQTWGSYCWLTPAGLAACDPSAFVVFSPRWFNASGVAPNGQTYAQLATLWQQSGGAAVPAWTGPTPAPTPPAPAPTPTPATVIAAIDAVFASAEASVNVVYRPFVVPALEYVNGLVDAAVRKVMLSRHGPMHATIPPSVASAVLAAVDGAFAGVEANLGPVWSPLIDVAHGLVDAELSKLLGLTPQQAGWPVPRPFPPRPIPVVIPPVEPVVYPPVAGAHTLTIPAGVGATIDGVRMS